MGLAAFTFSYQKFARYLQGNCDSEQLKDDSLVDERWLYGNIDEYLGKRGRFKRYKYDEFTPDEWKTGGKGKPKKFDIIGYNKSDDIGYICEAKLMIEYGTRDFVKEILRDIYRVAFVQDSKISTDAHRDILVVGQKQHWGTVQDRRRGVLSDYLLFEKSFWKKTKVVVLDEKTLDKAKSILKDDFDFDKIQRIPKSLWISLKGISLSSNVFEDENAEKTGIDVRLWRIIPEYKD